MKLSTLWTVSIILTSFLGSAQELHPKIATNINDERIPHLLGQWFLKPSKVESMTFNFLKEVNDAAGLKINFIESGNFVIENKYNKENPTKTGLWFLVEDKLYIETSAEKGDCIVYSIVSISDTLLSYTYYSTKNIYESSLCGDQRVKSFTDFPAKYGRSLEDFKSYISTNIKLSEQMDTINFDCIIDIDINCNGEVCRVRKLCDENKEFGKVIAMLLRQMPKWTPATLKGEAVNSRNRYIFSFNNGQIKIKKEE